MSHRGRCCCLLVLLTTTASLHAADVAPPKAYEPVVQALTALIEREVADKQLPALSLALVDDQKIVWARGFGFADPKAKKAASADTIYRVGSVSKLFTDLAVMQLVEKGNLDLDAPVTKYLPDFAPKNPFGKPITLRLLMSHRAGLVREPPVGNYFDDATTSLEKTVQSLNRTELVYEPGTRIKYSNAGIAVVGLVLEKKQKEAFTKCLERTLLGPMGMKRSSFEPRPDLKEDLAQAIMWTYHGRTFPAPTFEMGMAPAGSMYSTVLDLGKFMSVLFADGKGPGGAIVQPATLEQMWKPQFAKPEEKTGFGIGFYLTEHEGKRRIGHSGAIYGFATELAALPDDKLGVVVVASKDCANAVTWRVGDAALRLMRAAKQGKPLPAIEKTQPVAADEARQLPGRYRAKDKWFELSELAGRLWLTPGKGGYLVELRRQGDALIVDDALDFGTRLERVDKGFKIKDDVYEREPVPKPADTPERWRGLIGEYGWDFNVLYILERDGKLHALIEWFCLYPLEEVSENVCKFPDYGLYHGEKLVFERDKKGRATQVEAANVVFPRRTLDGERSDTFRIRPLRPVDELRREALAAKPPAFKGEFLEPDLVELTALDDSIKLDIRYATDNNFLSAPLYPKAKAFLQRPAAEAVVRAHRKLGAQGYGLLIHDGYRPWHVTKIFFDATPDKWRLFVANPLEGSRHNRGCAVDLTLFDKKTGKPIDMVGLYDEMSDRSYPLYPGGTALARWHRDLLRQAMQDQEFAVYEAEWWHFDYKDWRKYPVLNLSFEELEKRKK